MHRLAAFLVVLLTASASAAAPAFAASLAEPTIYSLADGMHAASMVAGPEDAVWFTGIHAKPYLEREAIVGRVLPGGQVLEFPVPPRRSAGKIAVGADGSLWSGEYFENKVGYLVARIGRMSTTGEFSEFKLGNHHDERGGSAVRGARERWDLVDNGCPGGPGLVRRLLRRRPASHRLPHSPGEARQLRMLG